MRAREVLSVVRTKAGLAVIGGALLLTGVGFGAHAAATSLSATTTSDVSSVTTPAASPTTAVATTPAPVVQAAPTSAATVAAVTTPETTSAAALAPSTTSAPAAGSSSYDPAAPYTDNSGMVYQPAPPPVVESAPNPNEYPQPTG